MIPISVVVPTHGRPELLRRCLDALLTQRTDHPYEIVVVDDGNSDATRQVVSALDASRRCTRYLVTGRSRGPAAARNAGWRAARGRIIAFTDDDCVPHPDWLENGAAAFVDGVAATAGSILVPLAAVPTDFERNAHRLQYSEFVTANCFYRRDVLEALGGFDERFTAPWREDTDLHFRLIARDLRLERAPDALVTHPVREAPFGVSLRQQRKSMFNALLYKKHPELYRDRVQSAPPWRYYTILAAALVAATLAVRRRPRAAAAAGAVWAALTARFCAERLRGTSHRPRHIAEMIVTSILIPPLAVFWRIRGAVKFRVWFL